MCTFRVSKKQSFEFTVQILPPPPQIYFCVRPCLLQIYVYYNLKGLKLLCHELSRVQDSGPHSFSLEVTRCILLLKKMVLNMIAHGQAEIMVISSQVLYLNNFKELDESVTEPFLDFGLFPYSLDFASVQVTVFFFYTCTLYVQYINIIYILLIQYINSIYIVYVPYIYCI